MKNVFQSIVVSSLVPATKKGSAPLFSVDGVITEENFINALAGLGGIYGSAQKVSFQVVAYAVACGIDCNDRKAFVKFAIEKAVSANQWPENPLKDGKPATLDSVRLAQIATATPFQVDVAKGIFAAWQLGKDRAKVAATATEEATEETMATEEAETVMACDSIESILADFAELQERIKTILSENKSGIAGDAINACNSLHSALIILGTK